MPLGAAGHALGGVSRFSSWQWQFGLLFALVGVLAGCLVFANEIDESIGYVATFVALVAVVAQSWRIYS